MHDSHTHCKTASPKRIYLKEKQQLTGKNARLQHKTSHHRMAEENKAIKNINDNYYGNIIYKKCLNFALSGLYVSI
jgi:cellobiose-specific phosphotransferase system component IIB